MTNIIAKYSIFKNISSWTEEGALTDHNLVMSEHNNFIEGSTLHAVLTNICEKYDLNVEDFEHVDENRYELTVIEDDDGNIDPNGKWVADYSVYIDLYKQVSPQECDALNRSQK